MEELTTFPKRLKRSHPFAEPSKGFSENILTPVNLSGTLVPSAERPNCEQTSDYKLIGYSGLEYFIISDDEWREVLSTYCWEEVRILGLLNASNMTVIPQKVYPKGPKGENIIDLASWKRKEMLRTMIQKVNDFVVIPAAVWAVLAP
jgi:hypothetical protein